MIPRELNSLGDHLRKVRVERGYTLHQVANMLGTSINRVFAWEHGVLKPSKKFREMLLRWMGYNPDDLDELFDPKRVRQWRIQHGLSRAHLAKELGLAVNTIETWERGRYAPSPENVAQLKSMMARIKGPV